MIEDVEDNVNELPDSDFSKVAAIVFDKLDNGKDRVFSSSKFADLVRLAFMARWGGGGSQ